jgi:hypothetical protein
MNPKTCRIRTCPIAFDAARPWISECRDVIKSKPNTIQKLAGRRVWLASRDREVTLANWTYESGHVQKHQEPIQL